MTIQIMYPNKNRESVLFPEWQTNITSSPPISGTNSISDMIDSGVETADDSDWVGHDSPSVLENGGFNLYGDPLMIYPEAAKLRLRMSGVYGTTHILRDYLCHLGAENVYSPSSNETVFLNDDSVESGDFEFPFQTSGEFVNYEFPYFVIDGFEPFVDDYSLWLVRFHTNGPLRISEVEIELSGHNLGYNSAYNYNPNLYISHNTGQNPFDDVTLAMRQEPGEFISNTGCFNEVGSEGDILFYGDFDQNELIDQVSDKEITDSVWNATGGAYGGGYATFNQNAFLSSGIWINAPDSLYPGEGPYSEFSVGMWIKFNDATFDMDFLKLDLNNSGQITFRRQKDGPDYYLRISNPSYEIAFTNEDDDLWKYSTDWVSLVYRQNSSGWDFLLNDSHASVTVEPFTGPPTINTVRIGRKDSTTADGIQVSNVVIWDRYISGSEASQFASLGAIPGSLPVSGSSVCLYPTPLFIEGVNAEEELNEAEIFLENGRFYDVGEFDLMIRNQADPDDITNEINLFIDAVGGPKSSSVSLYVETLQDLDYNTTLFTQSVGNSSGDVNLFMVGTGFGVFNESCNLFISGFFGYENSGNNLFLQSTLDTNIDTQLYLENYSSSSGDINLFIDGGDLGNVNSLRYLTIEGFGETSLKSTPLFIEPKYNNSGELPLFITNHFEYNENINLTLGGSGDSAHNNFDLFVFSSAETSDDLTLFVGPQRATGEFNLYLQSPDFNTYGNLQANFFTWSSNNDGARDSIATYINGGTYRDFNLYLKTNEYLENDEDFNLYLDGNSNIIKNEASMILINEFVESSGELQFYIDGPSSITVKDNVNLFLARENMGVAKYSNLYLESQIQSSGQFNMYIDGVGGSPNKNLGLVMLEPIVHPTGYISIYGHGY